MKRKLMAFMLSAALAVTSLPLATPAQADEDVAKVLAGVAGLYIISRALKDREERRATRNQSRILVNPGRVNNDRYYRNGQWLRYDDSPHYRKTLRGQRNQKIAPQRCLRDQWTHRGVRQVYGARCMNRNAQAALPQACIRQARTNSGPRRFYTSRCLRKYGWRA